MQTKWVIWDSAFVVDFLAFLQKLFGWPSFCTVQSFSAWRPLRTGATSNRTGVGEFGEVAIMREAMLQRGGRWGLHMHMDRTRIFHFPGFGKDLFRIVLCVYSVQYLPYLSVFSFLPLNDRTSWRPFSATMVRRFDGPKTGLGDIWYLLVSYPPLT